MLRATLKYDDYIIASATGNTAQQAKDRAYEVMPAMYMAVEKEIAIEISDDKFNFENPIIKPPVTFHLGFTGQYWYPIVNVKLCGYVGRLTTDKTKARSNLYRLLRKTLGGLANPVFLQVVRR